MSTVLVVDDEQNFADILVERLTTKGIRALAAYNGPQALDMILEHRVEVVLLDINMPGMDGLEALERIKIQSPHTAVILLTADSTLATAVAGMKLGADDYLLKPVDIEIVLDSIGEAQKLRAKGLASQRMAETAKMAALGEMAKGVAHEINNPMQVILNETGWIKDLLTDPELHSNAHYTELETATNRIQDQAQRCKAITTKLLALRCSLDTRVANTDLSELITALLAERKERLDQLKITVHLDLPQDLPLLQASRSEWEQVVANLLDNALDAIKETETEGDLCISAIVQGDELSLNVADTGCGIETHILARIFEPFFSTKDVGQGIGLGLSICHSIVEAMGGEISVQSTPGAGAVFSIRVPIGLARMHHS